MESCQYTHFIFLVVPKVRYLSIPISVNLIPRLTFLSSNSFHPQLMTRLDSFKQPRRLLPIGTARQTLSSNSYRQYHRTRPTHPLACVLLRRKRTDNLREPGRPQGETIQIRNEGMVVCGRTTVVRARLAQHGGERKDRDGCL